MNLKTALLTGITGQTCSYLAELLVEKGYKVYGLQRRTSTITTERIDKLLNSGQIETFYGDLADTNSIVSLLIKLKPDYVYNLGSQSHVRVSFDIPLYTADVTGVAPLRILESLRSLGMVDTRFLQFSSSEMFGISPSPQNENTTFQPQSPYGIAKLMGYWGTKMYRTGYKMFAANVICFNNESPRRGENFVTKKIVRAAVKIKIGVQKGVTLGNLEARRDWGFSGDYANAAYMVMENDKPDDFVVATGENHSIREFAELAFSQLGMNFYDHCNYDPKYLRPNEVPDLLGDATKIRTVLGWQPKVNFEQLVDMMVKSVWDEEIGRVKAGQYGL